MKNWISNKWCGLIWTDWKSFDENSNNLKYIENLQGLYRIKNSNSNELFYIGQTGRSLKQRLKALDGIFANEMPYNDPHTAAPVLWAYRIEDDLQFEFSCCYLEDSDGKTRKGYEDFLLWSYRTETGKSSYVNYGKEHPYYTRPTNRENGGGTAGKRRESPEIFNDVKVLCPYGTTTDKDWLGLSWESYSFEKNMSAHNVSNSVYCLKDRNSDEIVYIGETSCLERRMATHSKTYKKNDFTYFYSQLEDNISKKHRLQIESDLLGAFFAQNKTTPRFQYKS